MRSAWTRKAVVSFLVVAALASIGVFGVHWWRAQRAKANEPPSYSGNVDIRDVTLAFRVGGRVQEVLKKEGERVQPGEVIARLDAAPYLVARDQVRATVEVARAQLKRVRAGSRYEDIAELTALVAQRKAAQSQAADTLARTKKLVESGAATGQSLVNAMATAEQADAALRASQASLARATNGSRREDVDIAIAQLGQAESALAVAELAVADAELKSLVGGIIVTRAIEPGQIVSVGSPALVLSIDDPIWIRGFAPEVDLARLVPGAAVDVYTDSRPSEPYRGQIGYVATQAEFTPKNVETAELRTSLVYRFRVIVTDHDTGLRQGMPVRMVLLPGASTLSVTSGGT